MLAAFGVVLVALMRSAATCFSAAVEQRARCSRASTHIERGQREVAVSAFNRAVRENPKSAPLPHIYLARMAREVGNFTLANQELQLALQADPNNAIALREMGANLLTQENFELARRFYVRAVQADPTDKTAQGYLGCTLMRLGSRDRGDELPQSRRPGCVVELHAGAAAGRRRAWRSGRHPPVILSPVGMARVGMCSGRWSESSRSLYGGK